MPRAVFVPFRMGHLFGVPFHRELQRRIIVEALQHVSEVNTSGEIRRIPITWAEVRRQGIEIEQQAHSSGK